MQEQPHAVLIEQWQSAARTQKIPYDELLEDCGRFTFDVVERVDMSLMFLIKPMAADVLRALRERGIERVDQLNSTMMHSLIQERVGRIHLKRKDHEAMAQDVTSYIAGELLTLVIDIAQSEISIPDELSPAKINDIQAEVAGMLDDLFYLRSTEISNADEDRT